MPVLEKGRKVVLGKGSEYGKVGVVVEVSDGKVSVKLKNGKLWKGSIRHVVPLPEKE